MADFREQRKTLKDRIRHFTPSWFALVMGTGVLSALILAMPYGSADARWWTAFVLFALNVVLFFVFLAMSIARYTLFPEIWSLMLHHPVQSLFLACFPMGLATLISTSLSLFYTNRGWGDLRFLEIVWAFWWIDTVLSIACVVLLTYVMITRHNHSVETLNATWMLPIVTPIVASSAGGLLAYAWSTVDPYKALMTAMVSATMVIMGLSLALMMATIYLFRLVVHGFPAVGLMVSVFLPIGPCGQGGYAMLLIGKTFASVLPALSSSAPSSSILSHSATGEALQTIGVTFAFGLWAIGTWWATTATIGLTEVARRQHIPFRVNFWGVIFPSGVYSLLTLSLGEALHSDFFSILGTTLSCIVILAWGTITSKTIIGMINGGIFHAPCLDDTPLNLAWSADTRNIPADGVNAHNISMGMEMRAPSGSVLTIESRLNQSEV